MTTERACPVCGNLVTGHHSKRYCSTECKNQVNYAAYNEERRLLRVVDPDYRERDLAGSRERYRQHRDEILAELRRKAEAVRAQHQLHCTVCGAAMEGRRDKKYCSQKCKIQSAEESRKARLAAMSDDERENDTARRRNNVNRWYQKHREEMLAERAQRWANDESYRDAAHQRTQRWDATREKRRAKSKERHRELRNAVIAAYGGCCACCGELAYEFLAVDHIDGAGSAHRRQLVEKGIGVGAGFYRWLQKNGYPDGFRILCHNCNMAIGFYGSCPHQSSGTSGKSKS
jgi:predicted nucleic acid-binding Zn ribbon protein